MEKGALEGKMCLEGTEKQKGNERLENIVSFFMHYQHEIVMCSILNRQ
jgi:hypothetical protein